jgi:ABC-type bacteriocin/lantibiotic exporter with double-glycine peptidase domain
MALSGYVRLCGWVVACASAATLFGVTAHAVAGGAAIRLDVPVVRQAPERCGPAALRMVLAYHGAPDSALAIADRAYDPMLRGSLVTDLAARARDAGCDARIAHADSDSLVGWLASGVPPILLVERGIGPVTRLHYVVLTGFDPERRRFVFNDGGGEPREIAAKQLDRQWARADRVALVVEPRVHSDAKP